MYYSQQHTTDGSDLTGGGFLYRRPSSPNGQTGQGNNDDDDDDVLNTLTPVWAIKKTHKSADSNNARRF